MTQTLFSPKSDYIKLLKFLLVMIATLSVSSLFIFMANYIFEHRPYQYPRSVDMVPNLDGVPTYLLMLFIGWITPFLLSLRLIRRYRVVTKIVFFVMHTIAYYVMILIISGVMVI